MQRQQFTTYIFNHFCLTLTHGIEMPTHQHPLLQITLALESPFEMEIATQRVQVYGVFVGGEVPHRTLATDHTLISFLIDPVMPIGYMLNQALLQNTPYIVFEQARILAMRAWLTPLLNHEPLPAPIIKAAFAALSKLLLADIPGHAHSLDERVEQALIQLSEGTEGRLSAQQLASTVALSESRLIHLFKAEVGTTLRAFRLWLRLGKALRLIWQGKPLIYAAYEAGFADAAHLSRTSRKAFGIPPTVLFSNKKRFRVYDYTAPTLPETQR